MTFAMLLASALAVSGQAQTHAELSALDVQMASPEVPDEFKPLLAWTARKLK